MKPIVSDALIDQAALASVITPGVLISNPWPGSRRVSGVAHGREVIERAWSKARESLGS